VTVADYTDRYNTKLPPDQERQYQQWLATLPMRQRNTFDYDMRGAFKAGAGQAANGHFPDTFKKPNHPTFSSESQYNGVAGNEGGTWHQAPDGTWNFMVSGTNLSHRTPEELEDYFKKAEPGNSVQFVTPTPRPDNGQ
jgi:hypothetical protein